MFRMEVEGPGTINSTELPSVDLSSSLVARRLPTDRASMDRLIHGPNGIRAKMLSVNTVALFSRIAPAATPMRGSITELNLRELRRSSAMIVEFNLANPSGMVDM